MCVGIVVVVFPQLFSSAGVCVSVSMHMCSLCFCYWVHATKADCTSGLMCHIMIPF